MQNNYDKAKKILEKNKQLHIVEWMEQAGEEIKNNIAKQVLDINFDDLKNLYEKTQKQREKKDYKISQIKAIDKEKISEAEEAKYIEEGEKVLGHNKLAVVTMAGGQGTRLRT